MANAVPMRKQARLTLFLGNPESKTASGSCAGEKNLIRQGYDWRKMLQNQAWAGVGISHRAWRLHLVPRSYAQLAGTAGRRIVNVVPPPGRLSTAIEPWCSSMMP